jgi:hypothetical protein
MATALPAALFGTGFVGGAAAPLPMILSTSAQAVLWSQPRSFRTSDPRMGQIARYRLRQDNAGPAMNTIERARGRWREILPQLGVETRFLTNQHGPCPICGGKDRFRFDDRDGSGSYYCNQCGPGPGLVLIDGCISGGGSARPFKFEAA